MRAYVASRFKNSNKNTVEKLCKIVSASGYEDFSFVRDIENYQKVFSDPAELWSRSRQEIGSSDLLIIDITDLPSGGRVVEAGIAYGIDVPIVVLVKATSKYKEHWIGISERMIIYTSQKDALEQLSRYRNSKP